LFWVENIQFTDGKISSFGNFSEQIAGGTLTTKPLEHFDQVPTSVTEK